MWEGVKEQATRLQKTTTNKPDGVLATVAILREQVDYLFRTPPTTPVRPVGRRTGRSGWIPARVCRRLLKAPGATRKDRRTLKTRVEALRSEIFEAYIEEMGEDAEAVEGRRRDVTHLR